PNFGRTECARVRGPHQVGALAAPTRGFWVPYGGFFTLTPTPAGVCTLVPAHRDDVERVFQRRIERSHAGAQRDALAAVAETRRDGGRVAGFDFVVRLKDLGN